MRALDVSEHLSLLYHATSMCSNLNELASEGCWNIGNLTPRCLDVAECVAFVVFLAGFLLYVADIGVKGPFRCRK